MTNLPKVLLSAAAVSIAAASTSLFAGQADAQVRRAPAAACPVLDSSWTATVDAMPGPGSRPTLIVTGDVKVPTAGYRLSLTPGRLAGATQTFALNVTPPRGAAAEVISNMKVRAEARAPRGLQRVKVTCRGRLIANTQVTWAH